LTVLPPEDKIGGEMVYRTPRQALRRIRGWQALFLLCGLALTVADILLTSRGGICQSEGCRAVAQTPFTHIYGVPLTWIGAAFFGLCLLLIPFGRVFTAVLSLGMGGSLYFVFLQLVVIKEICQFCIAVESAVSLSFLLGLTSKAARRSSVNAALSLLVGFLLVHAAYTLPLSGRGTEVCPLKGPRAVVWRGPGEVEAQYFFDPHCPPCQDAFKALYEERDSFGKLTFRCVALKPESRTAALGFYSLVLEGTDPWKAVRMVHGELGDLAVTSKARELLHGSQQLLEGLGLQEVPLLVVLGQRGEILRGKAAIEAFLKGERGGLLAPADLTPPGLSPDLCNPTGCD